MWPVRAQVSLEQYPNLLKKQPKKWTLTVDLAAATNLSVFKKHLLEEIPSQAPKSQVYLKETLSGRVFLTGTDLQSYLKRCLQAQEMVKLTLVSVLKHLSGQPQIEGAFEEMEVNKPNHKVYGDLESIRKCCFCQEPNSNLDLLPFVGEMYIVP
jgi:hypothetical protein